MTTPQKAARDVIRALAEEVGVDVEDAGTVPAEPAAGVYEHPVSVTLKASDPEAIVVYSTASITPDSGSPLYAQPIYVPGPLTLTAIADGHRRGVKIVAYLTPQPGPRPSIVELKMFCGRALPSYMNPDAFVFLDALPRTSTNKVDYQGLVRLQQGARMAPTS